MAMLRPTSEMKDSGIEWVGQIPSNWKVVKNNRLFRITKSLVNDAWETTQLLSLTKSGIIEKDINDGGGKQPESFSTYQFVKKDDIVLCLFDIDVSAVYCEVILCEVHVLCTHVLLCRLGFLAVLQRYCDLTFGCS